MKKIFKKSNIFSFLLGAVIFTGITSVAAYSIFANDIGYTPSDATWKKSNGENITNVEEAIDELYTKANKYNTLSFTVSVQPWTDNSYEQINYSLSDFKNKYSKLKIELTYNANSTCSAELFNSNWTVSTNVVDNQFYLTNDYSFLKFLNSPPNTAGGYCTYRLTFSN